jgi:hypothetical protein
MEFICGARYLGAAWSESDMKDPAAGRMNRLADDPCRSSGVCPMLDIAYIAIGAVFLGLCVLYALACDHL